MLFEKCEQNSHSVFPFSNIKDKPTSLNKYNVRDNKITVYCLILKQIDDTTGS